MSLHVGSELISDPGVWIGAGLLALIYARGAWVLWRRAGMGHGLRTRQAAAFAAGLVAVVLALGSPLDHLAEELLSAHMVQHLLLLIVAAPLLVLGEPEVAFAWALPRRPRLAVARRWRRAGSVRWIWAGVTGAGVAWALHLTTLYTWHLPSLYQAALAHEGLHAVEHMMFLGTGFLFWKALFRLGGRQRLGYGAAALYLFTAALAETPLGALMLFSQQPWYPAYAATAPAFGLTVLQDQQLAGSIMWVPPGLVMLGIAVALFLAWLEALEKRMQEQERLVTLPLEVAAGLEGIPAGGGAQAALEDRGTYAVDT